MVCVDMEGAVCSVTVAGDADVMVTTIVDGVSDSVITIVESCVFNTVSVCMTELVTVVADPSPPELPPSTATTE